MTLSECIVHTYEVQHTIGYPTDLFNSVSICWLHLQFVNNYLLGTLPIHLTVNQIDTVREKAPEPTCTTTFPSLSSAAPLTPCTPGTNAPSRHTIPCVSDTIAVFAPKRGRYTSATEPVGTVTLYLNT